MKKYVVTVILAGMGFINSNAQMFPEKAQKKNDKMMEKSYKMHEAAGYGETNKAIRQSDKMQKKQVKLSKKSNKFK